MKKPDSAIRRYRAKIIEEVYLVRLKEHGKKDQHTHDAHKPKRRDAPIPKMLHRV